MNWLGKVFVVLILIMSLMFMALSLAVYATHKNWKEVIDGPTGLKRQLDDMKNENMQLQTKYQLRDEELQAAVNAEKQQVAKLESERNSLVERNALIQTELDQQKQDQRNHIAAVAATQDNNTRLATEVTSLRQQIRTAEQARDEAFATTLTATEKLHQVAGEYESARERTEQLTKQVGGMTTAMQENGLDPDIDPTQVVPIVDGLVSQVRRTSGTQYVEVTIGADDGLKSGNTVEIFRGNKYLGRVDIVSTSPDKSVGKVDRRFQQGQIQEGDRVATRLKL
jgi:myosin heavy subunit